MTTRRQFVAVTSQALAGVSLVPGWSKAGHLPASLLRTGASAATLVPERFSDQELQHLASTALDVARSAGASYADIRVGEWYQLDVGWRGVGGLDGKFGYGVRVRVDGAWAFVHGGVPDIDRMTAAVRDAVTTARGYAALGEGADDFAPTPAVTGRWDMPIQTDPFVVPLQDQVDLMVSLNAIQNRALGGRLEVGYTWQKERRVYGSTEGSLVTQTLYGVPHGFGLSAQRTFLQAADENLPHFDVPMAVGYEAALNPALPELLKAALEDASRASLMPVRRFDVGRFPVVVDGAVMGKVFGATVGAALDLDRALGADAGLEGSSFLAPPSRVLGEAVVHPLLNVTADRVMPHIQAVRWDDEGVATEPYPVLRDGVVVDYHTSRQTAPTLRAWYERLGQPVKSNGCTLAMDPMHAPVVQSPHLTVAPSAGSTSLVELCREMRHGLLVTGDTYLSMDQQLSSGLLFAFRGMFEVVGGRIVGRVKDAALQFRTKDLWKTLQALGGPMTTMDSQYDSSYKGFPWQWAYHTASAPAALFGAVDIVNIGRVV